MDFAELPVHLNCQHVGTFSPVRVRFEGGNDYGGFCVEEYHDHSPMVTIYGDISLTKNIWAKCHDKLGLFVTTNLNSPAVLEQLSDGPWWYVFDCRMPDCRVSIHEGPTAIPGGARLTWAASDHQDLERNVRSAIHRIEAIYRRFYNE